MKLFYSPGACALASQISLREADLPFELIKVDLKTKTFDGNDYLAINPKGYVPALLDNDNTFRTESSVILQWIADQVPEKKLIPNWGSSERYVAMEWLNFIATEMHKGFSVLFYPQYQTESSLQWNHDKIQKRLAILNDQLKGKMFVLGDSFTVVDAYAYNILHWHRVLKIDLADHPEIQNFMNRMNERPSVKLSIAAEGIRL